MPLSPYLSVVSGLKDKLKSSCANLSSKFWFISKVERRLKEASQFSAVWSRAYNSSG